MPTYSVPEWVHPGGLRPREESTRPENRVFGGNPNIPVYREAMPIIPKSDWDDMLAVVNRPECSSLVWNIYNQASVGSCAAEAENKMGETIRELCGRPRILFNAYATYHYTSGGRDNGSSLPDNVDFGFEKGCIREEKWPRSKGWKATPSDDAMQDALNYRFDECFDIDDSSRAAFETEIGSALLCGLPAYVGIPGHAILLTELLTKTTAKYANSWDKSWGENGFGKVKLSELVMGYGAFVVRAVRDAGEIVRVKYQLSRVNPAAYTLTT